MRRVKHRLTRADHDHVLDGGAVGTGRELAIDEDACGEVHLALVCLIIENIVDAIVVGICGEPTD
jgi:hypothetical protein